LVALDKIRLALWDRRRPEGDRRTMVRRRAFVHAAENLPRTTGGADMTPATEWGYEGPLVYWVATRAVYCPLPWVYGNNKNIYIEDSQVVLAPTDWDNPHFRMQQPHMPGLEPPPPGAVEQMQADLLSKPTGHFNGPRPKPREVPDNMLSQPEESAREIDGAEMSIDPKWAGEDGKERLREHLEEAYGVTTPGNIKMDTLLKKLEMLEGASGRGD
jgi:hypothetical protein